MTNQPTTPAHYRRRHRLAHARDYQAAFQHRLAKSRGPFTVFLNPNNHTQHRLGLSIGRRVGGATVRVRLKRAIRESFRLDRSVYPQSPSLCFYDIVVSARAHKPLPLNEYRAHLRDAIAAARREHARRLQRSADRPAE